MKPVFNLPPKLALTLLDKLLPLSVKDDIIGDLTEEFVSSDKTLLANNLWFWQQSISTCGRYVMNSKNITSLAIAVFGVFVFIVMASAIRYLSYGNDEYIYQQDYWTNGSLHLFFTESVFWRSILVVPTEFNLQLFINIPSIIWTAVCLSLLVFFDKKIPMTMQSYALLSLISLCFPYLYGILMFNLTEVPLRESGPIIAFMWLPIMYLIPPLCYGLIKKYRQQTYAI